MGFQLIAMIAAGLSGAVALASTTVTQLLVRKMRRSADEDDDKHSPDVVDRQQDR
jgi:hypothetical protein